jgi:hypothetical protein
MFGAGALSGLLGIGSGAMKVLAMDQAMKIPFKVSTTTSNFMIGVTAAASAGVYLNRGYIDVHWSVDGWRTVNDTETVDTGLGLHAADLPTRCLTVGTNIVFTFYWPQQQRWECVDFTVEVPTLGLRAVNRFQRLSVVPTECQHVRPTWRCSS